MTETVGDKALYRTACRLRRELAKGAGVQTPDAMAVPVMYLDHAYRELSVAWRRLSTARRRGWHLAAVRLEDELWPHAQRLHRYAQELLALRDRPRATVPDVGELLAELRQLRDEFDVGLDLDARRRRRLAVRTERIVLDGLDLGPFEIALRLDRLSRLDPSCFNCVALDPHPAGSDASVTHPHVKDAALCTGEATAPIGAALSEGRLVDAFLLVRSGLQTYNPHSPYVHIDEWDDEDSSCPECGDSVDADRLCHCEDCGRDICDDCTSSCELCDCSCCRACLERDDVSRTYCCPACRQACGDCARTVDADHVDAATGLCTQCLAQRRSEQDPLPHEEDQYHAEHQREDPDQAPGTAQVVAAAAATADAGDGDAGGAAA